MSVLLDSAKIFKGSTSTRMAHCWLDLVVASARDPQDPVAECHENTRTSNVFWPKSPTQVELLSVNWQTVPTAAPLAVSTYIKLNSVYVTTGTQTMLDTCTTLP
jgi:hypothetical protein